MHLKIRKTAIAHLLLGASLCLAATWPASAATVSVTPVKGATGVGTSTPVVFTFSAPMDVDFTDATFMDMSNFEVFEAEPNWNSAGTVLTYVPSPSWPTSREITWVVNGETLDLEEVFSMGSFTTGTSSTGGGTNSPSGTNAITSFVVGKMHYYVQDSNAPPVLETNNLPYAFLAITSLASNRTATAIEVTAPTSVTYDLDNFADPEDWTYYNFEITNLTTFDATYPAGNYVFKVTGPNAMTQTVNLPANMQQPNAPRILNFAAAQTLDPTKPFTLTWEPFQGGTAKDHIAVSVGTNVISAEFMGTNSLPGNATSVVIPANTLIANEDYRASVMFIRENYTTNNVLAWGAYRSTITDFPVNTVGGGSTGGNLPVTSAKIMAGGKLGFEIRTTPGQSVTIESSPTLQPAVWTTVLSTNASGTAVQFIDQRPVNGSMFYRVR